MGNKLNEAMIVVMLFLLLMDFFLLRMHRKYHQTLESLRVVSRVAEIMKRMCNSFSKSIILIWRICRWKSEAFVGTSL